MNLLVSLISDQTIPNVLCIDYFRPDALLMVSTDRMGEKIDFIVGGLKKISKDFDFSEEKGNLWIINVNPESPADVEGKIENWFEDYKNKHGNRFDEIIANVTGGTKMMSLGLYNAVKASVDSTAKKSKIVYIPINTNRIVDLSENCAGSKNCEPSSDVIRRLNIIQYLESNGIRLISQNDDIFNDGFNDSYEPVRLALHTIDVSRFIMQNYESLKSFLASLFHELKTSNLPFNKKNKPYPIDIYCIFSDENQETSIKLIKELFNFHYLKHLTASPSISKNKNLKVNIAVEITEPISVHHYIDGNKNLNVNIKGEIAKHEFEFLTGGWLERFCFNELYELKEQGIFNDIGINARVRNASKGKEAENEFDVLFTYNNNLYMVECKSLNQGHDSETDILYKISALQADLGRLTTKSFLASTASENIMDKNNPGEIKETLVKRAKLLNCSIIIPSDLINIREQLKKELKIN
ncbi:MAG: Card1-like endonuclease domain-containing protein [bacterium]